MRSNQKRSIRDLEISGEGGGGFFKGNLEFPEGWGVGVL